MQNRLELEEFSISYGNWRLLREISFSLQEGEILGLAGPSGVGKSSLLRGIMGLQSFGGQVRFNTGQKSYLLSECSEREYRKLRGDEIALIFQKADQILTPSRRIGEEFAELYRAHRKWDARDCYDRGIALLRELQFANPERIWRSYVWELSGGMQQRVAIALSLLLEPGLLLADEPSASLDKGNRLILEQILKRCACERQMGILLVSHDIAFLRQTCDRILFLKDGRLVERGGSEEEERTPSISLQARGDLIEKPPLLRAEGLGKYFLQEERGERRWIFRDLSLSLRERENLGIRGESGAGKSTLARILAGLIDASSGIVVGEGRQEAGQRKRSFFHRDHKRQLQPEFIQLVFQSPIASFDPRLRLKDSIAEFLEASLSPSEREERVLLLLKRVGLGGEFAERYPHQISGGEGQRAAIARALAKRPRILILDEATASLDTDMESQIMRLLLELQQEYGISYIIISHKDALLERYCHRIMTLQDGQLVE